MTPITATNPQIGATNQTPNIAETQLGTLHQFAARRLPVLQLAVSSCNAEARFPK